MKASQWTRKFLCLFLICIFCLPLWGCAGDGVSPGAPTIAVSAKPLAELANALTEGTEISVQCMVTEPVSCLHDYSLSVNQMRLTETADAVFLLGCGLEEFMEGALTSAKRVVDCSQGIALLPGEAGADPHYWLDPLRMAQAAETMANALSELYPQYADTFSGNLSALSQRLRALADFRADELAAPEYRELVTFHDGFAYLADFCGLSILASMEEEAGSETAAADLSGIIKLIRSHKVPAVFTEVNGSDRAARTIAEETGVRIFTLDTCLGERDYFSAMEHNINTISEALS